MFKLCNIASLTTAIEFRILPPAEQADERYPGVINIPIQLTLDQADAVLQTNIDVFVSVEGGTATSKSLLILNKYAHLYILSIELVECNIATRNFAKCSGKWM